MTTPEQPVLYVLRHWLAVDVMGVQEMTPAQAYIANKRLQAHGEPCRWVEDTNQRSFEQWIQEI